MTAPKNRVTAKRLRELLEYNQTTGMIRWKKPMRSTPVGWYPGSLHRSGYMTVQVDRCLLLVHRVAVAIITGDWPVGQVDHRDRSRANNVWENLRPASPENNAANRTVWANKRSGLPKGVHPNPQGGFVAKITKGGMNLHLGTFSSPAAAKAAYDAASGQLHGDFASP